MNKTEYYNMDDIDSLIELCDYNENLVDKYTKVYDDIFDNWDFDSAINNNQSNLNIENFMFAISLDQNSDIIFN